MKIQYYRVVGPRHRTEVHNSFVIAIQAYKALLEIRGMTPDEISADLDHARVLTGPSAASVDGTCEEIHGDPAMTILVGAAA